MAEDLEELGEFPLINFWGPGADIRSSRSSRSIADAALKVMAEEDPSLMLVYLPHLDYDHQRHGPDDPRSAAAVAQVLDREEQAEWNIDHARSGELVCVAEPGCWFAYHYWLDEGRRPDFANTVDIHRKPGYDPTELFLDPKLSLPKLKIASTLLKKVLGFRYLMNVIGTDPSLVQGSHGRLLGSDELGPVFLSSSQHRATDRVSALEVKGRILDLLRPS